MSCLNSWSRNNAIPSFTGELSDSVLVAVNDLRLANTKLVELKYEKEINANLRKVVANDSIIIESLNQSIAFSENKAEQYKKQRNIIGGAGIGVLLLLILSLL